MSDEVGKLRYRGHRLVVEREDGSEICEIVHGERWERFQFSFEVGYNSVDFGMSAVEHIPHRIGSIRIEFEQVLESDRGFVDGDAVEDDQPQLPGRPRGLPRGD